MDKYLQKRHNENEPSQSSTKNTDSNFEIPAKIPRLFDGKYFKIVSRSGNNIKASCVNCVNKIYSGSITSTGNFITHITRLHPQLQDDVKNYLTSMAREARPTNIATNNTKTLLTSTYIKDLITNYITSDMRPISTVESPGFINLIRGLAGNCVVIPSRKTVSNEIEFNYNKCKTKLLHILKEQSLICTTADIWSCNNKSYLGMTVNFLNENLTRSSYTLSFKRIKGSHNFDLVGNKLFEIHNEFGINDKIAHEVTDSASYFIKAFKFFMKTDELLLNSDIEDDDEYIDTPEIFLDNYESEDIILPPHLRCCAHTMNLIATSDVDNIIKYTKDNALKKKYRSAIAKIQAFFNIANRSTKAADLIYDICKCKFPNPVCTRWNSWFDAITKLCMKKDDVNKAYEDLKLTKLNNSDWEFLLEYTSVMKPIAFAIDYFQGEESCYLGVVAPTVNVMILKYKAMTNLEFCKVLRDGIVVGIEKRFENALNFNANNQMSKNFILSAVTHPKFKLSWIPEKFKENCKRIILHEYKLFLEIDSCTDQTANPTSLDLNVDAQSDFFAILSSSRNESIAQSNYEIEVLNYLNNKPCELSELNNYPIFKKLFVKYNTTIPSSAPVERLFSSAVQIFTPRRNRLSDEMFEKLLFLKGNRMLLQD